MSDHDWIENVHIYIYTIRYAHTYEYKLYVFWARGRPPVIIKSWAQAR